MNIQIRMNIHVIWPLAVNTFKESIKSKWLVMFSVIFFLIGINLPTLVLLWGGFLSPNYLTIYFSYFVTGAFPFLPLLSLPLGAMSVVDERESGSLQYLLANPISREEFLTGKFLGLLLSTSAVVLLAFGVAALISYQASLERYFPIVNLALLAVTLNAVMLALALSVSVSTRRKATALGLAIFSWFAYSVLSNLNSLGVVLNLSRLTDFLVALVFLDPVESARILGVMQTPSAINQVGVTGAAVFVRLGPYSAAALIASLLAWAGGLALIAFLIFRRRDLI